MCMCTEEQCGTGGAAESSRGTTGERGLHGSSCGLMGHVVEASDGPALVHLS